MNIKFKILILISILTLFSCSNDEEEKCIEYHKAFVTKVSGPSSANVHETVSFEVKFRVFNGCGHFDEFIKSGTEFNKIIQVKAVYKGCFCLQNAPIRTTIYKFTPSKPGNYTLNFQSNKDDFIVKKITVE